MGQEVTIGGERLGSGNKSKVYMHGYERSTHDLGYVWRSTMSAGTLVPFLCELALPGDTFDISLNCDVLTHPTIGPLFGSYKIQLDLFQGPIRLYQAQLQMNQLEIGMKMSTVLLPQVRIQGRGIDIDQPIDNQQIHPSCIYSYLNIRGVGFASGSTAGVKRKFNAIPLLMYWDTYKCYYANKQEEIGAVIHKNVNAPGATLDDASVNGENLVVGPPTPPITYINITITPTTEFVSNATLITSDTVPSDITIWVKTPTNAEITMPATGMWTEWFLDPATGIIHGTVPNPVFMGQTWGFAAAEYVQSGKPNVDGTPTIKTFPLANIDTMRKQIMQEMEDGVFLLGEGTTRPIPYNYPNEVSLTDLNLIAQQFSQEGLALKTYNSDLFNNWMQTEWIDGVDGISEITAIDTSGGSFTIDELNMQKKLYLMLNRIALSDGSYHAWLDAVYDNQGYRQATNPMYVGGLIQNLVFQEVVSTGPTPEQPLGTLAGRGRLGNLRKGGNSVIKVDEPSYIMGIISLTPNIDYSQGNKWDMSLRTLDDLHKPALDEIGFQDLTTDQMAWWDTPVTSETPSFRSAGKQPAWINYMTNVNQVRGNFADQRQQMFMTLNRRYGLKIETGMARIKDLTTYIDPTKFNHIFADTRLDAQNFWVQVGVNMEVRRKMSAKVMPNL